MLKEVLRGYFYQIAVLSQYLLARLDGAVKYALDLFIYLGCDLFGIALGRSEITPDEYGVVAGIK